MIDIDKININLKIISFVRHWRRCTMDRFYLLYYLSPYCVDLMGAHFMFFRFGEGAMRRMVKWIDRNTDLVPKVVNFLCFLTNRELKVPPLPV